MKAVVFRILPVSINNRQHDAHLLTQMLTRPRRQSQRESAEVSSRDLNVNLLNVSLKIPHFASAQQYFLLKITELRNEAVKPTSEMYFHRPQLPELL